MHKQVWFGMAVLALAVVLVALAACGGTGQGVTPSSGGSQETPAALDGQALTQERCATCHGLDRVQQAKKSQDGWKTTVERMVAKGAQLTQAEQDAVVEYLAKTYPQ